MPLTFAPSCPVSHRSFSIARSPYVQPPICKIGERTLAVDYGLRRVGLAVSVGVAPRALPRIEHSRDPKAAAEAVAAVAKNTIAVSILVGLPVDIRGVEGEQAEHTRKFLRELTLTAPWARIMSLDERFTSQDAQSALRNAGVRSNERKLLIDSASAVVLLERFFGDGDDFKAQVIHEPVVKKVKADKTVERIGFAEWKKEAMKRARLHESIGRKRIKK